MLELLSESLQLPIFTFISQKLNFSLPIPPPIFNSTVAKLSEAQSMAHMKFQQITDEIYDIYKQTLCYPYTSSFFITFLNLIFFSTWNLHLEGSKF